MRYLLAALLITVSYLSEGQEPNLVQSQGIVSDIHRNNIGKIRFSEKAILPENFEESDFLSTTDLTNKTNLYMNIFMANSITNYVHILSPGTSLNDIYTNANLQFTFYVDNQQIYQENLQPGAGVPARKDKETIISRPLLSYRGSGWWSEYLWNRFKNNGGNKALTEGKHLFRLEVRPYTNLPVFKTGEIIAAGEIEVVVKIPKIDISKIFLNELKPYDGFGVSNEPFDKDKIKMLKGNIEEAFFRSITSVVVIKNNKLLIEEYFNGAGRDSLHNTRSVGKSFASTMTGIAIADGYLKNENLLLKDVYQLEKFSNNAAEKRNTPIKDLLTMSSVFSGNDDDGNSPGNEENMYPTDDWVKFTLDLPVDTAMVKGQWHYFTAGVVLLGDILNRKVPGGLEKYAHEKLFQPLGIRNYRWQHTPQGVANTAGGLQMNSLDYAKYGQLYKNRGVWNGKRIISADWVDKTFSKQKTIPKRNNEFYGYLFWNKTYEVQGKKYETYYCAGNGGNKIFVFKDQPLVVVVTATAYGTGYAHAQVDKMMEEYILPAVMDPK